MPSTHHKISLFRGGETVVAVLHQHEVQWIEGRPSCRLELTYNDQTIAAQAIDWFEALVEIRKQIEPSGFRVNVYGASQNVWPSGMCRGMGLGRSAYQIQIGRPAERKDLVSIFATGADIRPVTVAEQEWFKDEWFSSLQPAA